MLENRSNSLNYPLSARPTPFDNDLDLYTSASRFKKSTALGGLAESAKIEPISIGSPINAAGAGSSLYQPLKTSSRFNLGRYLEDSKLDLKESTVPAKRDYGAEIDAVNKRIASSAGESSTGEEQSSGYNFSKWADGIGAIGGLGLGVASYMDNRKTSSLQRKALKQDIAASAAYNERMEKSAASWDAAWAAHSAKTQTT